ncbi:DUF6807 family protein [Pelagicoccus mobilis]|uniref:PmoA family protein n=1 Tax=Pelagicoccus mobilis TaxID=415221 RepID=A0A934RWT1_9BACT|nr:DUF6807 family protein [Pelagicoccus mobilis]MBK1875304.1 PmoA family protein [Pelagicoccus mobilis]
MSISSTGFSQSAEFAWDKSANSLALLANDKVVWRHNHDPAEGKPYIHPLSTVDGSVLTELRPEDHPWHRALWFSWKFINGVNYWEENRQTGQSEGKTEIRKIELFPREDFSADIVSTIVYQEPGFGDVLTESRTVTISPPDELGNYQIDWKSHFKALTDITLDRTPLEHEPNGKSWGGYAGLSLRMALDLRKKWKFSDSEGRTSKIHGSGSRWVRFSGKVSNDKNAAVTFINAPDSEDGSYIKYYIAEGMPYFSPAILFETPKSIKEGNELVFKYRILVESDTNHEAQPQVKYQDYRNSVELVELGKEMLHQKGCQECHSVEKQENALGMLGPSYFGLLGSQTTQRTVSIPSVYAGKYKNEVATIDDAYVENAIRTPNAQLAIYTHGPNKGNPYPPVMPAYSDIEDLEVKAITAYLKTLNSPENKGPEQAFLVLDRPYRKGPPPSIVEVKDQAKIVRVSIYGTGTRSICVGLPGGYNYLFDPSTFAVSRVWYGDFLDIGGERHERGTGPNHLLGDVTNLDGAFLPLGSSGPINQGYKDYVHNGDFKRAAFQKELRDQQLYSEKSAADAPNFLGYLNKKDQAPVFLFEIEGVEYRQQLTFKGENKIMYSFETRNADKDICFQVDNSRFKNVSSTRGTIEAGILSIPAHKASSFSVTLELNR